MTITNSEEIIKIIEKEHSNISGIAVLKKDHIAFEKYFNDYTETDTIHIASVTKSIFSILIGIAIDKGYIENVRQKVLEFFPDYKLKRGEKNIQKVTVEDLLTMTAPFKYKSEPYTKVYSSDDWTVSVLDLLGGRKATGEFKYTTIGIQILSGILTKSSGQSVLDFATKYLFDPLGIKRPPKVRIRDKEAYFSFLKDRQVSGWVIDPQCLNTAGWGLALTTRDLVKIGQLYLNQGIWNGEHLISSQWIETSIIEHSQWGDLSYGYLWWLVGGGGNMSYAAMGDGGNIIYVSPEDEIVVAITASFQPRAKNRIDLIKDRIIPFFKVRE